MFCSLRSGEVFPALRPGKAARGSWGSPELLPLFVPIHQLCPTGLAGGFNLCQEFSFICRNKCKCMAGLGGVEPAGDMGCGHDSIPGVRSGVCLFWGARSLYCRWCFLTLKPGIPGGPGGPGGHRAGHCREQKHFGWTGTQHIQGGCFHPLGEKSCGFWL